MRTHNDGVIGVMMRELTLWVDFGTLLADPVFYGIGVAHGYGKLVVIIPGFMGNDFYLMPMFNWLRRIGYTPVRSTLDLSAGCLQRSCDLVKGEIDRHLRRGQRSVALIGHSRGGAVAWALASQMQEQVSHLVMLGAAIPGFQRAVENGTHTIQLGELTRMLLQANKLSRRLLDPHCRFPSCECTFTNHAERPLTEATALVSIYGSNDLLIPEEAKMVEGQVIHVRTAHVGLVYHPEVYRVLGRFLAQNRQPADRQCHPTRTSTTAELTPLMDSFDIKAGTGMDGPARPTSDDQPPLAGAKPDDLRYASSSEQGVRQASPPFASAAGEEKMTRLKASSTRRRNRRGIP